MPDTAIPVIPTVPVTPSTAGAADVVVTAGHEAAQSPVQALVVAPFMSLVKT